MIVGFKDQGTEDLYNGLSTAKSRKIPQDIHKTACRKLDMIDAARDLRDLKVPPANRLEALKGLLKGKYSIRINDQFRIVFEFKDNNAYEVEIVDYH